MVMRRVRDERDASGLIVEQMRRSVGLVRAEGEALMSDGRRRLREAAELDAGLAHAIEGVRVRRCPFCGGEMVDLAALGDVARELSRKGYAYEEEDLAPTCRGCGTYATGAPRDSALRWLPEDVEIKSKTFAAKLFDALPAIEEVALERAVGRGWMVRERGAWYANRAARDEIEEMWGI